MPLELRIVGPALDVTRRLEAGGPALILGRDAECGVCLPDPLRSVSRRHLSVWNQDGELHFHVLSAVNGVEMPFGEAPPGARGVLPPGQIMRLAEYSLTAQGVMAEADVDPWAALDRATAALDAEASGSATRPAAIPERDPFGDWGFEAAFGADMPGAGLQAAGLAAPQDMQPFFRGLGLDPAQVGALSQGELESIGRMVRSAVLGLAGLHAATRDAREELNTRERTMLAPREVNNPLKNEPWPAETTLRYLFGGRDACVGFMTPERAMREIADELAAHEQTTRAAMRALVEGILREFEPEALKAGLLGEGTRLFESARAWDAFARHYAQQGSDFPAWVQRLIDRHFGEAYARIRRDTSRPR